MDTETHDVIIVGGGAAGLSAALVLSRARRRVLVIDSGEPRNAPAAHMHGFLSRDGMTPAALLATGRSEVAAYGGEVIASTVEHLTVEHVDGVPTFVTTDADGRVRRARRLIITTGLHDEIPDIPGLRARWGRDVLHCPYCHGYEVRDRRLAVLWHGPGTPEYAQLVRQWSHDVVLIAPADVLDDHLRLALTARAIGIVEDDVVSVDVTEDRLTGLTLAAGTTLARDALFVPPRFVAHTGLLDQLGCEIDDEGWVVSGPQGATSIPGVRVAGNVVNPRAQVITAAGEGSAAAIAVNAELVELDVRLVLRQHDLALDLEGADS